MNVDDLILSSWGCGLLADRIGDEMADEIKIASARSLINSSGDSCVRFMALTEVGAAIGGSEGDRLQRVGIDAGAEIGLGNVGVMPLRERLEELGVGKEC